MSVDQKSIESVERMIRRMSGLRGPVKSDRDRNAVAENFLERPRSEIVETKLAEIDKQDNNEALDAKRDVFVLESPRAIPILDKCEVLVVGGGPSGISAALGARRAGCDVVLMERFGCFGGVITTVGMETIGWYRYEGCTNDVTGVGIEMERLAAKMGGSRKFAYNESECLDADYFKVVADHLIKESGVRPILHCFAVEAIVEDGLIKGVITESKSGRMAILANRVIDCTGDADIAFLAGAQYRETSKEDRMGMTTVLNVSGVDNKTFLKYTEDKPATYQDWSRTWKQETSGKENHLRSPYLDLEFEEARQKGFIPTTDRTNDLGGSWSSLSSAGEATNLNLAHIQGLSCLDVLDLTKAEIEGREQAMNALMALKGIVPGFDKSKLRNFGMTIGTRDSRKIIGRYNLTGEDVKNEARFEDSVGIFPEFIDGYNVLILPTSGRYFQVPYGCLVPVNIDNLLVAGRCVSGDKVSHAAMRNMMACTVSGQSGKTTSEVDIKLVQTELERQGVRIF